MTTEPKKLSDHPLAKAGTVKNDFPDLFSDMEATFVDQGLLKEYNRLLEPVLAYLSAVEEPADLLNEAFRPILFARLSYGLRKSGEALAWALRVHTQAQAEVKTAAGIAATEEFAKYVETMRSKDDKFKPTEPQREAFVHVSATWRKSSTKLAMTMAMVEQLKTYKLEFMMGISTLKAILYGGKDSDMMNSASVGVDGT